MGTQTTLFLIRHGETVWNAEGRMQGYRNSDLNPRGAAQAEAVGAALAGEAIEHLYSSDLGRAKQTVDVIARHCGGLPVRLDARLRERNLGRFETLTRVEIERLHATEYADYRDAGPDYVIPDGESARQRYDRSVAALREITAAHPGGRVCVVTHGGVLNGYLRFVLDIPLAAPRKFALYNAAINVMFADAGVFKVGTWGAIHHLKAIGAIDDP